MRPDESAARASSRASAERWNTPARAASFSNSFFTGSALRLAQPDVQLAQLLLVDRRRSVREQVLGALRLGKGDHIADRVGSDHHRDEAVEAEGDPAVRRRAILQRLQQEAEFLLRFLGADRKSPEDLRLHLLAVYAN